MKKEEDDTVKLERRTDAIVDRYGRNPEKILAAARTKGIETEYWSVAARELAKIELKKDMAKNVRTILNCIAISHFGRPLSAKISEILGMDFSDDVKQAAIKAISESEGEK